MTGNSDQLGSVLSRVPTASHARLNHGYTFKLPLPSCLTHLLSCLPPPPPAQLRSAVARRPSLAVSANRPTAGPNEVKECAGQHVYNDRVPRLDRARHTDTRSGARFGADDVVVSPGDEALCGRLGSHEQVGGLVPRAGQSAADTGGRHFDITQGHRVSGIPAFVRGRRRLRALLRRETSAAAARPGLSATGPGTRRPGSLESITGSEFLRSRAEFGFRRTAARPLRQAALRRRRSVGQCFVYGYFRAFQPALLLRDHAEPERIHHQQGRRRG